MTSIQLLEDATKQRKVLHFNYDNKPRVVEPHALGVSSKGATILRAFQTNDNDGVGAWKLFTVDKIQDLSGDDQQFVVRPDFRPGDRYMATILAEVAA